MARPRLHSAKNSARHPRVPPKLVFSLEAFEFLVRFQQAFRQFAAFWLIETTTEFALVGMMFELAVDWGKVDGLPSWLDYCQT